MCVSVGVPPHVLILQEMRIVREEVKENTDKILNKVAEDAERRHGITTSNVKAAMRGIP